MSLPSRLSTSISTSRVRELGSIALAVRTSLPVNVCSGKFGKRKRGRGAGNRCLGVDLGNVHIDAQHVDGREAKHLRAGSGVDQLPYIDIAGSDDSTEGRINFFE